MQRFTARIATAVHQHSPLAVTTGSASLKWSTNRPGGGQANFWNDTALTGAYPAGGASATLDFYNIHYYDWMFNPSWGYDPARDGATPSYWGLDKPTVVGEVGTTSTHYSNAEMLDKHAANGFAGDLFWALNDPSFPYDSALSALSSFSAAHSSRTSHAALLAWLRSLRSSHASAAAPMEKTSSLARAAVPPARLSTTPRVHFQYSKTFSRDSFLAAMKQTAP
jgi:hypothetical protein